MNTKSCFVLRLTSPDGVVAMTSANGLVGTGFASRYRLQPRTIFKHPMGRCKATTPSSLSLTSNRVTTKYKILSKTVHLITRVCTHDRRV